MLHPVLMSTNRNPVSKPIFGKLDYSWLGRILITQNPEIAKDLIATYYSSEVKPIENDLSKVNAYFLHFCTIQSLNPDEYRGNLYKSTKQDTRLYFIAAMLHIYRPKFFLMPTGPERYKDGLARTLSEVLQMDKSVVSRNVKQILVWQKCYDDFRMKVECIVEQLKHKEN